jgi:hypothetical protein
MAVPSRLSVLRSRWFSASAAIALVTATFTIGALPQGLPGAPTPAAATSATCDPSALPPPSSTTASPGQTTVIQQDAGTVEVPPTAVDQPT